MRPSSWLRPAVLGLTLLLAACPGDDGPTEPTGPAVATVTVTPSAATLEALGATTQLQASAKDASGNAVTGKTVAWSSSNQAVATVSTAGLATAVGYGTAAVTATVGGVAGSALISVSQPKVSTVEVAPAAHTLAAVGLTVQLTATAKSSTGSVITGQTVAWASSAPGTVAVSNAGLATAVAPGLATVTATVGGVTGSSVITVSAPCASPTRVTLNPGQSQSYDPASCLLLPSGSSGDRYRVVVLRPTETGNASDVVTATLKVVGLGVSGTSEPPLPSPAPALPEMPGLSARELERAFAVAEATERFHAVLRERERLLLANALPGTLKLAPTRSRPALLSAAPSQASSPSKITLDITTSGCSTSAANKRTAVLIHEDDNLAIYQDSTQNTTKPITVSQATKLTDYYARHAKAMIESYFGKPSDVDGNGKVVMFASPVVAGDVAAFVWSGNFFKSTGQGSCAASNERELIYFNTDLILAMEGSSPNYQALETVAHEMKHVVSLYNRIAASIRLGSAQYHPTWVEEGTAEIAGEMSSRIAWASAGGPAVNAEVTRQSFVSTGSITGDNYGVAIKLARTAWYLSSQPNGLIIAPTGAQDGASVYGSGWLFHRWLGDAFGAAASAPQRDATFFRALNDSMTAQGTAGIAAQTGRTFLDLVDEFTKTVALHKTATVQPALNFTTYDLVSAAEIFCTPNPLGVFPWPVTTTGTRGDCNASPRVTESSNPSASFRTADFAGSIGATGMRVHDFVSNGTGTGAQIQLDMTAPAKLWVVRLK